MEVRQMTANDLRKLAEAVDGIRDVPAYVVWGKDGPTVTKERPEHGEPIFECMTKNTEPGRAKFRSITLDPAVVKADGKPMTDIAAQFDAMFWTEAAVEKFVLPYYMRMEAPEEVSRIRKAFNHESVFATTHMPDSTTCMLTSIRSRNSLEALTLREFEALL